MASQKQASTAPQPQFAPAPEALAVDEPEGPRDISATHDVSLDDADHKLSQSEMKDRAIKHLFDVINSGTVNEEHAKAIFDRYDSRSVGTWTSQDLRLFLFDLQEAFRCPRVVPDEALADVLKEIQLNLEASGGITWVEFKSYMLFLQQQPLEQLHETVTRHAPRPSLANAVIASSLPPKVTREHLATVFAPVAEILHLYLVEEPSIPAQALIVYPNEKAVNDAVHLTGTDMLGVRIRVVRFEDQEFPTLSVIRKPGAVPQVIAKAYVAAKEFDEKAKITETISKGVDTASKQIATFAEEHKIKEKAKAVADKTGEAVKQLDDRFKISQTANEFNEKYQITQKAQKAKEQVLANQHVQAVGGFFSNLAAKVQQSVQEFADETREAINEEQRKKAGPAPNQFEMGARGGEGPQTPGGPQ